MNWINECSKVDTIGLTRMVPLYSVGIAPMAKEMRPHRLRRIKPIDAVRLLVFTFIALQYPYSPTIYAQRAEAVPENADHDIAKAAFRPLLIDGLDASWKTTSPAKEPNWILEKGTLTNSSKGPSLATRDAFWNFELHLEFKLPQGCNSGIFLRGRYEVQLIDSSIPLTPTTRCGAVRGLLPASDGAYAGAEKWNTAEIVLVDRMVTVRINDRTVVDQGLITKATDKSFPPFLDESTPGPIVLQQYGKSGAEFRNIRIKFLPGAARDVGIDPQVANIQQKIDFAAEVDRLQAEFLKPALLVNQGQQDRRKLEEEVLRQAEVANTAGDIVNAKRLLVLAARNGQPDRAISRLLLFKHSQHRKGVSASDTNWTSVGAVKKGDIVITEAIPPFAWGVCDENGEYMVESMGSGARQIPSSKRHADIFSILSSSSSSSSRNKQPSTLLWEPTSDTRGFPLPTAPPHSLIGKVGKSLFYVGQFSISEVVEDGELQLMHNCDDSRSKWAGALSLTVIRIPAE